MIIKLKYLIFKCKVFFQKIHLILFVFVVLGSGYFINPEYSFASDGLVKILQSKYWIESGYKKQGISYLGKDFDTEYQFYFAQKLQLDTGDFIAPFPFLNSVFISPFVRFVWYSGIVYFGAVLFILYSLYLRSLTKVNYLPWLLLLCSPLLHHFLLFSDVALSSIFILIFFGNFYIRKKKNLTTVLSLLFLLFGIFLRTEALILLFLFASYHFFTFVLVDKFQKLEHLKSFVSFVIVILVYSCINWIVYQNILGPRFEANKSGIVAFSIERLSIIQSLLFSGNGRVGMFFYAPWLLLLSTIFVLNFKAFSKFRILLFGLWLGFVVLVSLFSSNDSNIDWGSRYFTTAYFLPILVFTKFLKIPEFNYKKIIGILFLVLTFVSLSINRRVFFEMRKISTKIQILIQNVYRSEIDLIFTNELPVANAMGVLQLKVPVLFVSDLTAVPELFKRLRSKQVMVVFSPLSQLIEDTHSVWKDVSKTHSCEDESLTLMNQYLYKKFCKPLP